MGKSRRKARRLRKRARIVRKTSVAALELAQGCVQVVISHWKKPDDLLPAYDAGIDYARKATRDSAIYCELRNLALETAVGMYVSKHERELRKARVSKNAPKKDVPKSELKRTRLENVCRDVALYTFFGLLAAATGIAHTPNRELAMTLTIFAFAVPFLFYAFFPSRDVQP